MFTPYENPEVETLTVTRTAHQVAVGFVVTTVTLSIVGILITIVLRFLKPGV